MNSTKNSTKYSKECYFCKAPSDVIVEKKRSLCWLHYYTSRAVREENVQVLRPPNDEIQDLFAQAFVELQQELSSSQSLDQQDPLAILHTLRGSVKKPPPPPRRHESSSNREEGGFLKPVPLPERFLKTQQQLMKQPQSTLPSHTTLASTVNPYQRRKPARQPIWKLAMEQATTVLNTNTPAEPTTNSPCPSCGSQNTSLASRPSSHKVETWGSKERADDVQHQCHACHKVWND
jgi:hypothetical protein